MNHVEADTAIFTIYNKIYKNKWKGTIVIDAEDTDIYVQVVYVQQKVSGELLIKKKSIYVDSWTLFITALVHVIIQLHVMTGCDHNCGFYGHGHRVLLHQCGDVLPIPANVWNNLKICDQIICDQICLWE